MEQPKSPAASPPPPQSAAVGDTKTNKSRRQPPSPEEMIAFYESKGLDRQAASLKAIEDLQSLLLRGGGADASRRDRLPPAADLQRKLDNAIARLAILDMKLDSKPSYPESLAVGVASGALLRGLSAALPSALRALGDTWRSVSSVANHRTPPS